MFQNNSVCNSLFIVECIDVNRGSILDNYASRDVSLSSCNLYQFITNYTTIRGQVRKRSAPVVVRHFQTTQPIHIVKNTPSFVAYNY